MKVTVAKALGTCFGVQDAIDLAMDEAYRDKLTIVGQLVHNPQVVEDLRIRGVNIVDKLDENISTPNVMITAHGAPESMHENARRMGYHVIDASCPLVLRVHKAIAGFVREGFHPVVIGQASHVEVKGIIGDLQDYTIIANEDELSSLAPYQKIGIVSQTTQQIQHVKNLIAKIREVYPQMEVRFQDTVCQPTKDRQVAARELTSEVDIDHSGIRVDLINSVKESSEGDYFYGYDSDYGIGGWAHMVGMARYVAVAPHDVSVSGLRSQDFKP